MAQGDKMGHWCPIQPSEALTQCLLLRKVINRSVQGPLQRSTARRFLRYLAPLQSRGSLHNLEDMALRCAHRILKGYKSEPA